MPAGRVQGRLPFTWLGVLQFSNCKAHVPLTTRGVEEVRVFVCLVVCGCTVLALGRFFVQRGEGKETCSIALREGM